MKTKVYRTNAGIGFKIKFKLYCYLFFEFNFFNFKMTVKKRKQSPAQQNQKTGNSRGGESKTSARMKYSKHKKNDDRSKTGSNLSPFVLFKKHSIGYTTLVLTTGICYSELLLYSSKSYIILCKACLKLAHRTYSFLFVLLTALGFGIFQRYVEHNIIKKKKG